MNIEKKLTAMQELVNDFTKMAKNEGDNGFVGRSVLAIIKNKKSLEKEKQHIIDASVEMSMHGLELATKKAEEYFNQTFKNE